MSKSFFRGDALVVLEELGGQSLDNAKEVVLALCKLGVFHTLDEFEGFHNFNTGRYELRVHRRYSGSLKTQAFSEEYYCTECGELQEEWDYYCVGCGGILPPPAEPPAQPEPPKPVLDEPGWQAIERLDISMHK